MRQGAGGRNQTREGNQQGHPEPGQPGSPCGTTCSRISSYSPTPTERARTGMTAFSDRNSPRSKMALSFAWQLSQCTSSRSFASVSSGSEAGRETSPGSAYPRVALRIATPIAGVVFMAPSFCDERLFPLSGTASVRLRVGGLTLPSPLPTFSRSVL